MDKVQDNNAQLFMLLSTTNVNITAFLSEKECPKCAQSTAMHG